MWIPDIPQWAVHIGNLAVVFGAGWFVQSTVILSIGLLFILLLHSRGAAVQSLLLRLFLAASLLVPAVSFVAAKNGLDLVRFSIPAAHAPMPKPARVVPGSAGASNLTAVQPVAAPSENEYSSNSTRTLESAPPQTGQTIARPPAASSTGTTRVIRPEHAARHTPVPLRAMFYCAFALAWGVTAAILLGRILFHTLMILYLRRTAFEAAPGYIERCRAFSRKLGVRCPEVLQNPSVRSPFLAGFVRPAVFLPLGEEEKALSPDEALLHEIAHLSRHDTLWNLVRHGAAALLPFQPLVWVYSRRIEETSDYACDDLVVRNLGNGRLYALNLTNTFCALDHRYDPSTMEVGFVSPGSSLRRRVERLLDASRTITTRIGAGMLVLVYSLSICVTSVAGLVGFRGRSFEQIRAFSDTIARKAAAVTLAAASAIREQATMPVVQDTPVAPDDTPDAIMPEPDAGETVASLDGPASDTASAMPTDIPAAGNSGETSPSSAMMSAETMPVRTSISDAKPAVSIPEAPVRQAAGRSSGETASSPSFLPSFLGLQSSNAGTFENIAAKSGPLSITVPPDAPATLRESLERGQENPVWSPTGKIIAFTGRGGSGIWAVSVKGGKPELVYDTTPDKTGTAVSSSARILCFSPTGDALTFVRNVPGTSRGALKTAAGASTPTPIIETVNLLTGERRELVSNSSGGRWSRDGRYFAYVEGDGEGIRVLDIPNGTQRQLSGTGLSLCLTPDGASIIYVDETKTDWYDLYRVSLSGGAPEKLTDDGSWWEPECSPDGEWVLSSGFGALSHGPYAMLRAFNLRERRNYFIRFETSGNAEMGSWSPTGRQFCYTRTAETAKSGQTVPETAIYIENFQPTALSVSSSETAKPAAFGLLGNYPNPFNPSTTIRFSLPSAGIAELVVYNIAGQKIRELTAGRMEAGTHSVVWNGRNQQGNTVSSGVYIAQLKMEGKVESRRMTLVK